MQRFSPKTTNESYPVTFGWANILATGETISTAVVNVTVLLGTDSNAQAIVSGAAQSSGTDVLQRIVGGINGVTYLLTCRVTTSLGNTFEAEAAITIATIT